MVRRNAVLLGVFLGYLGTVLGKINVIYEPPPEGQLHSYTFLSAESPTCAEKRYCATATWDTSPPPPPLTHIHTRPPGCLNWAWIDHFRIIFGFIIAVIHSSEENDMRTFPSYHLNLSIYSSILAGLGPTSMDGPQPPHTHPYLSPHLHSAHLSLNSPSHNPSILSIPAAAQSSTSPSRPQS